MPAFRLLNQFPVYFDRAGRLADGGRLLFFETDTTTPKDVFGDPGLSVNNGNSVTIGSDGRAELDIWGDGRYYVRLEDADGTLIADANHVEVGGGSEAAIPPLQSGAFLTNNGSLLLWSEIREVPDPTGQGGKILGTDGDVLIWQPQQDIPEPPEPDIQVTPTKFRAGATGGTSKFTVLTGTGQAAATGDWISSVNVSFPTGFSALWNVVITPMTARVSNADSGYIPASSVTGWTAGQPSSSVTVNFVLCEDDRGPANRITSPVPFAWTAIGLVSSSDDPPVTPA